MLNKDHKDLIASLAADAISEYETKLLIAVANRLMSTDLTPYAVASSSSKLRQGMGQLSIEERENITKAAQKGIEDGFMVNAITEVM